jgi:hypothetical protein
LAETKPIRNKSCCSPHLFLSKSTHLRGWHEQIETRNDSWAAVRLCRPGCGSTTAQFETIFQRQHLRCHPGIIRKPMGHYAIWQETNLRTIAHPKRS